MLKACLWHEVGFGVVPSHKGKAFVLEIRHVEGEVSASIGHGSERIIISGSWDLQIGTLRADDSHRVKSRCVPGDFLSWFVPTKVFHSCPHQWSLSEKLQIQHWRRCAVRLNTSQLSCQLGSWSNMQSNISRSHPVCSISVDLSQLTKLRAYGIQKELQFSKKSLESWMCYPSERNYITTCHKMMPVSECCGLIALGDAMRYLQPPLVFCIFDSDAGQVRSLTSPRCQASRSRNWLEQIAHAAALETQESQIGLYQSV